MSERTWAPFLLGRFPFRPIPFGRKRFSDRLDRGASPTGNHSFDIGAGYFQHGLCLGYLVFLSKNTQVLPLCLFFSGVKARLFVLVIIDACIDLLLEEADLLLRFDDLCRQRDMAEFGTGSSFVDYINGLARQVTVRNTEAGIGNGACECVVAVPDTVKFLEDLFDSLKHQDRIGFARWRHLDGLKERFEPDMVGDRLRVDSRSGYADTLQLSNE